MGTDWYAEQWPASRWETDVSMMESAHLAVVRLAGFAWSRMEPSEGRYDFEWLDHAIRLAARQSFEANAAHDCARLRQRTRHGRSPAA